MFPDLEYIRWIEGRPPKATHDLGSSDLEPFEDDRPPSDRCTDLPEPPDRDLTAILADRYEVAEEWVVPAAGATHANVLAAVAALDLADDPEPSILVEKPGYEPLRKTPELFGADVDRFLRPGDEDSTLDPQRVAGAVTDGTAMVTVTNRHNPSGRLVDREDIAAVAAETRPADAPLLVDEVYGPFSTDPDTTGPFGGVTAAGLDGVVVTGSLTKFHGLGPLRVGWLIGPPSFAAAARKARRHLPAVAGPSVEMARRALGAPGAIEPLARERLAANHETLSTFVADRDDLSGTVYPGSSFAFVAHESVDGDDLAAAAWEAGVLVIPGRFFERADGVRVCLSGPTEETEAGLEALADVLDSV